MMRINRTDRSLLAEWWFTFDRLLLVTMLVLIFTGIVLSLAASPDAALRKGLPPLYFAWRHIVFAGAGVVILIAVSFASPRMIRRLALILFLIAMAAMIAVLFTGDQINGAKRWLRIAGFSIQPSEFAKPAFVILSAWAFAEAENRPDMPAMPIAVGLLITFASLLILQPDIGQTVLIVIVWGTLLLITGRSIAWVVGLAAMGLAGLGVAYLTMPYIRLRLDRFFGAGPEAHSQLERAYRSFQEGGFLGRGPGEGTIKTALPDAHTDFPFAVVAEEYGVIACLIIVFLFAVLVLRPLARAVVERDPFTRQATTGLALLIGLQALINMGVNVGLIPVKGMTLPFISAGGSSTIAIAITCGMLIAITRRRPDPSRLNLPGLKSNGLGAGLAHR